MKPERAALIAKGLYTANLRAERAVLKPGRVDLRLERVDSGL